MTWTNEGLTCKDVELRPVKWCRPMVTRSTQTVVEPVQVHSPGADGDAPQSCAEIVAAAVTEMASLVEQHSRSAITASVQAERSARQARRAAESALMEAELVAARATDSFSRV